MLLRPAGRHTSRYRPVSGACQVSARALDPVPEIGVLTQLRCRPEIKVSGAQNIDSVGLLSGEPGAAYRSQVRPKTLEITTARGNSPATLSFDDTANFQDRPVNLHAVTTITITVKSGYPGQNGQAVAIPEVEFSNRV